MDRRTDPQPHSLLEVVTRTGDGTTLVGGILDLADTDQPGTELDLGEDSEVKDRASSEVLLILGSDLNLQVKSQGLVSRGNLGRGEQKLGRGGDRVVESDLVVDEVV